jgi:hypothetical protein
MNLNNLLFLLTLFCGVQCDVDSGELKPVIKPAITSIRNACPSETPNCAFMASNGYCQVKC